MPHNPASIVRLLYGERTAEEETAPKRFLSVLPVNSLTSAPPIGQGHRLRSTMSVLGLRVTRSQPHACHCSGVTGPMWLGK